MVSQLEAERLLWQPFVSTDTSFILKILNSPGFIQFIGDKQVRTEEQALNYLTTGPFESYQKHGFGLGKVLTKEGHQPIGICGFLQRDFLPHPDIGYAILPEHEGRGYVVEAVGLLLEHGFTDLGFVAILAIVQHQNSRSINVLTKTGFVASGEVTNPQGELLRLFKASRG